MGRGEGGRRPQALGRGAALASLPCAGPTGSGKEPTRCSWCPAALLGLTGHR